MVKIRYAELPAGLHVATEAGDRCTIVYLKPGLTRAQRKEALTVARRSAQFGHGPSLPALDMAFALAADRTRTTTRLTSSAMRKHPLLLLPLLALVLGIIAAGVLATVAIMTPISPAASSAQSSHFVQSNISRLVAGEPGGSARPQRGAPGPGTARAGSVPGQATSHGHAGHGKGHARGRAAASVPGSGPVWSRGSAPVR
jgi:hypothetical protein